MEKVTSRNGVYTAQMKNGVITESHCEMAGYYHAVLECIEDPDTICKGNHGELIALKEVQKDKYIAAIYRSEQERWVCDNIFHYKKRQFERRKPLWEK